MIVAITGASGFIGRKLVDTMRAAGDEVRTLGRSKSSTFQWDALGGLAPPAAFNGTDVVIHLAGEPVAQRWNDEVKRRIAASRITGTRNLVAGLAQAEPRPRLLLSASAIGYYGDTGDTAVDERAPAGRSFLAEVAQGWEEEAARASQLGIRVARMRFGIVLGREGGALPEMLVPFRLGAGGPLASGKQWMSWIHIDDLVNLVLFAIERNAEGPLNVTAPEPVRNIEFTRVLAGVLGRPAVLPIPKFALRLRFGEAATHMVESLRVLPWRSLEAGFNFRFPELQGALRDLLA